MMNDTDSIIYLDTDALVLSDITDLWSIFKRFDEWQIFACANETDVYVSSNWYQRNSVRFPFYGVSGFNSGVLLMNLTRMRDFRFVDKATLVYEQYGHVTFLVDQDILNILAFFHPEITYSLDCAWNFRTIHCGREFICAEAARTGPKLLHGNMGLFDGSNLFRVLKDRGLVTIYRHFDQVYLRENSILVDFFFIF